MTEKIELKVYGTRGSCATGSKEYMEFGGDTSSYTLRHGDNVHFLDAGSGIRRAMANDLSPNIKRAYLYISHGHADHIDMGCASGIYNNKLEFGIEVIGYSQVTRALAKLFDDETMWPVHISALKGLNPKMTAVEGGESFEYPNYRVSTLRNFHPSKGFGGSVGFRFDMDKKVDGLTPVMSIAYVTDMEFDYKPGAKTQEEAEKLKRDFVRFVSGVDLLVADTHFTREEYEKTMPFVRGWGHANLEQVIDLANEAGVRTLVGAHHAPQHTDELLRKIEAAGKYYAKANGFRGDFALARDGDVFSF